MTAKGSYGLDSIKLAYRHDVNMYFQSSTVAKDMIQPSAVYVIWMSVSGRCIPFFGSGGQMLN
jgi:hypothetical protein